MHQGCSIGVAVEGRASHRVAGMVLGGIPAESPSAKRPSAFGQNQSLDDGLPSGGEDGYVGSPEQALSHA